MDHITRSSLHGTEYADEFEKQLNVFFLENNEVIAETKVAALPYHSSVLLFCHKCGDAWGRIHIEGRDWRVEYSCCKLHRKEDFISTKNIIQIETIKRNMQPTFDNAVFGLRFPDMPRKILLRDFLYLCSKHTDICQ